jgi:hypothetical protein
MRPDFPTQIIDDAEAAGEDGLTDLHFYRWLASDAGPEDWHRFAMGGNWGIHDPIVFEWIVSQPECDRATALLFFWKAQPEYEVEFPNASNAFDRDEYGLIQLVRERWQDGRYSRSELAFSREADVWPIDFNDLDQRFGGKSKQLLPDNMRVTLPGLRLELHRLTEGIPNRFWPEELWDQQP